MQPAQAQGSGSQGLAIGAGGARHEQDLIQAQGLQSPARQQHMAHMHRVEGSAEEPDAARGGHA